MKTLLFAFIISFTFATTVNSQIKISGYVIEMSTGTPIQNATVFVHDEFNITFTPSIQTTTNEDGYYEFTDFKEGKYSINAFVYYEALGDSIAYIYQPGVLTVPEINTSVFKNGIEFNFAFSEVEFRHLYYMKKAFLSGNRPLVERHTSVATRFLKPRVESNVLPYFKKTETILFEKKTW